MEEDEEECIVEDSGNCPDFIMEQLDFDYCAYAAVYDQCADEEISCEVAASVYGQEFSGSCEQMAEELGLDIEDIEDDMDFDEECGQVEFDEECPQFIFDQIDLDSCRVSGVYDSCSDMELTCHVDAQYMGERVRGTCEEIMEEYGLVDEDDMDFDDDEDDMDFGDDEDDMDRPDRDDDMDDMDDEDDDDDWMKDWDDYNNEWDDDKDDYSMDKDDHWPKDDSHWSCFYHEHGSCHKEASNLGSGLQWCRYRLRANTCSKKQECQAQIKFRGVVHSASCEHLHNYFSGAFDEMDKGDDMDMSDDDMSPSGPTDDMEDDFDMTDDFDMEDDFDMGDMEDDFDMGDMEDDFDMGDMEDDFDMGDMEDDFEMDCTDAQDSCDYEQCQSGDGGDCWVERCNVGSPCLEESCTHW
jgi:hypothetical protein